MNLIPIFVTHDSADGLWSIHLEGESQNEFEKFFDQVNDIKWLHIFFGLNKTDLQNGFFGSITIGVAVSRTLNEAEEMENALYDYSEHGFEDKPGNLQHLFKPLNNFEYTITALQKSKTRIGKGWLRLYAIRLAENCYLVTGGAIKLTLDMRRPHLQNELKKLESTKQFLRSNGIDYPEDLNNYKDE
jgi:hypothetical protein